MAKSVANVLSSPAQVLLATADLGHTQGGVEVKISPKTRERKVDQFGETTVAVIHQGDEARAMTPLAEYVAATLAALFGKGNDQTAAATNKFIGFGASAGTVLTPADLKITPLLSSASAKLVNFFAAVPIGNFTLKYEDKSDIIFNQEWAAVLKESYTEGNMLGAIMLAGTPPTT